MAISAKDRAIIHNCAETKEPVLFSAEGINIGFQSYVLKIADNEMVLKNTVKPEFISRIVSSNCFFVQLQMMRFSSDTISSDGCHIVFPLESLKVIKDTRQSERRIMDFSKDVVLEILNPFDNETIISRSVLDISETGLSVRAPVPSKLYESGTCFKDMIIKIDQRDYKKCDGKVVYNRQFFDISGNSYTQVGIQFEGE